MRAQHTDQQLALDKDEKDKYFGDAGRKAFFALYKTMFRQRQLFVKTPKEPKKKQRGGDEDEDEDDDGDEDEDDDDDDDEDSMDEAELMSKMVAAEQELSPRTK